MGAYQRTILTTGVLVCVFAACGGQSSPGGNSPTDSGEDGMIVKPLDASESDSSFVNGIELFVDGGASQI